jgi:hypothetical protein
MTKQDITEDQKCCICQYAHACISQSQPDYLPQTTETNQPTPRSTVLPEKLTGPQLVKTFPTFYGTQRSIIAFTKALHPSAS